MKNKSLSYFINLDKFPINEPKSSKYQNIIKEAQEALEFDGLGGLTVSRIIASTMGIIARQKLSRDI